MTLQYINHPVSNWPVRQYFPDPEVISWKALRPSWSLARRLSRIHFKAAKKFQSSLMRAWKRLKKPARALCFVLLALCPFDSFWNWSLQALHAPSVQLLSELPKPAPVPKNVGCLNLPVLSWSYAQGWRTFKAAKCEARATLLHQNTADLAFFPWWDALFTFNLMVWRIQKFTLVILNRYASR